MIEWLLLLKFFEEKLFFIINWKRLSNFYMNITNVITDIEFSSNVVIIDLVFLPLCFVFILQIRNKIFQNFSKVNYFLKRNFTKKRKKCQQKVCDRPMWLEEIFLLFEKKRKLLTGELQELLSLDLRIFSIWGTGILRKNSLSNKKKY